MQVHKEPVVIATARQVLTDGNAQLEAIYYAQAEDIIEVTIRSRSKTVVVPVKRKVGHAVSALLADVSEQRQQRLHQQLLELLQVEGEDASLELKRLQALPKTARE